MQKAIFVHGCFWHQHNGCIDGRLPRSRRKYWVPKLQRNKQRDVRNRAKLRRMGWRTLVIWDCQTTPPNALKQRLLKFLRK